MQGEIQILDVARATVRHLPPAPVAIEQIDLRDGIGVYIQNHRPVAHVDSTLLGDDMLKFHVQLSGQRILNFEGRHAADLSGARTAVLMHEVGVTKTERLIAERDERSLTISIARQRFWEFLGEEKATASSALRSFIVRKRASPRLATATPSLAETAVAAAIIGCERAPPLRRIYVEAKVMELFCLVLDRFEAGAAHRPSVRLIDRDRRQLAGVRDLLVNSFTDPPTIHSLARQFGLNRNKLCSGFQLLYGASIFDFCQLLRLDKARDLLATSEQPIAEIALATGFSSPSAFSAAFSRQFGQRPSQCRRS